MQTEENYRLFVVEIPVVFSKTFEGTGYVVRLQKELLSLPDFNTFHKFYCFNFANL